MFEVLWKKEAELELARVWLDARDRMSVTRAAATIESLLRRDPLNVGESRSGKDRIVFVRPLAVSYRVRARSRQVLVLAAGRSLGRR
jgi:hypothetical protein